MYETYDENGRHVLVYELLPQKDLATTVKINLDNISSPIYQSKNSHKKTNKRKR